MAECRATAGEAEAITACLLAMESRAAAALDTALARAGAHFADLDLITGNQEAGRVLAQGQAAFALYRDLDCHLVALTQGVSATADDHRRACRIDHDRARTAALVGFVEAPQEPQAGVVAEAPVGDSEPGASAAMDRTAIAATDDDISGMLLATSWQAAVIDGEPVATGVEIMLHIDDAGEVVGRSGCNRYFAKAELANNRLEFETLGATRMACPEPAMGEERRYLRALEAVIGWQLAGDMLELLDMDGVVRVRLTPVGG